MAGWFPELAGLAGAIGDHAGVLDGEVVAFDGDGRPSFGALQGRLANRAGRRRGPGVTYLVFDLLWLTAGCSPGCPTPSGGGCWRSWRSPGRLRHPAYAGLTRLL
jgi:hypothetical protein